MYIHFDVLPLPQIKVTLNMSKIDFLKKRVKCVVLLAGVFFAFSCGDELSDSIGQDFNESVHVMDNPIIFTKESPTHDIIVDGRRVTITLSSPEDSQKSQLRIAGDMAGPYQAPVPVRVGNGKHKKVYTRNSQFDYLSSYMFAIMRFDKYAIEINLPKNAFPLAIELIPVTAEGFAQEDVSYRGYELEKVITHATGHKIIISFYIQMGAAYDFSGRQLTPDIPFPIEGNKVRYNYRYMLRE